MGGLGSGNFRWGGRKATVEESLALSMRQFRGPLVDGAAGELEWTRTGRGKSSTGYRVAFRGELRYVVLNYRWRGNEDVEIPVRLQTTPTQFGGRRWWFTCPLVVNDVACQRRVGKLYLPPGAKYFGCRTCHRLTHRSSQQAHQAERLAKSLARQFGCDRDIAEIVAARWRGSA